MAPPIGESPVGGFLFCRKIDVVDLSVPHPAMGNPARGRRAFRVAAGVAFLVVGTGMLALPELSARAPEPSVHLRGRLLEAREPSEIASEAADGLLSERVTLKASSLRETFTWRELGAQVERNKLEALLHEARDVHSPMRERHAAKEPDVALEIPLPVALDARSAAGILTRLASRWNRDPIDARLGGDDGQIQSERAGRVLDVWASIAVLEGLLKDRAAQGGGEWSVDLAVQEIAPSRRAQELARIRTDAALGTFETRYNASEEAQDRTYNLRIAAQKIDGAVLFPGEVLDFNELVGERNRANGFRPAPVIAGGELVDGVGGGACQVAGTLYAAAFFAGLKVLERHPHSRPSYYIKLGLDAAVSYPRLNLRLQNNREVPVVIRVELDAGYVRARVLGPVRDRTVEFHRRILRVAPFPVHEVKDPSLPKDVRVLAQRGVPGFTVSRTRIVLGEEGEEMLRESGEDTYPPTREQWRIGASEDETPEGFIAPKDDPHPEYIADEHTVLRQGPGIEGTETERELGSTGSYGWTKRRGLAIVADP